MHLPSISQAAMLASIAVLPLQVVCEEDNVNPFPECKFAMQEPNRSWITGNCTDNAGKDLPLQWMDLRNCIGVTGDVGHARLFEQDHPHLNETSAHFMKRCPFCTGKGHKLEDWVTLTCVCDKDGPRDPDGKPTTEASIDLAAFMEVEDGRMRCFNNTAGTGDELYKGF